MKCFSTKQFEAYLTFSPATEISEYEESWRRSLSVQEGSAVLIECPLPHSVPPALPRLRVRGEWIEESKGEFVKKNTLCSNLFLEHI